MNFLISYKELENLLKGAGATRPKKHQSLTISALASRVFVEFQGDVAGTELIVLSDGAVTVPAQKFLTLVKTYTGTRSLNFVGGPTSLKIQNFTIPILAWEPNPTPPLSFKIFPPQTASVLSPDSPERR